MWYITVDLCINPLHILETETLRQKEKRAFNQTFPDWWNNQKIMLRQKKNNGADIGGRSYLDLIDEDLEDLNEEIDSLMFEKW